MNRQLSRTITLLVSLLICLAAFGQVRNDRLRAHLTDSLRKELATETAPRDSIQDLYNLYDISTGADKTKWIKQIFETAKRGRDAESMLDAGLRYSNGSNVEEETFLSMISDIKRLPKTSQRDEALLFMWLRRHANKAYQTSPENRAKVIAQIINKQDNDTVKFSKELEDVYRTFKVIIYLSSEYGNAYLDKYLDHLGTIIGTVEHYALRNQYFTTASMAWASAGDADKCAATCRQLLTETRKLEISSAADHPFRSYNLSYYNIYRRMLRNFEGLNPGESDACWFGIQTMAENDKEVAELLESDPSPQAYYLMSKKSYEKAVPLLQKTVAKASGDIPTRIADIKMLAEAARETQKSDIEVQALRQLKNLLTLLAKDKADAKYRELQIMYEQQELEAENDRLQDELNKADMKQEKLQIWAAILSVLILGALLYFIIRNFNRSRLIAADLSKKKTQLQQRDEYLRSATKEISLERTRADNFNYAKDQFIQSIGHDMKVPIGEISQISKLMINKLPEGDYDKIEKYAGLISRNAEQMEGLIDDVLFVSSEPDRPIESEMGSVKIRQILDYCFDLLRQKARKNIITNVIDDTPPDFTIVTDSKLVDRILANLIDNACYFTREGFVEVRATFYDEAVPKVIFTVSDSGPGIPKSSREEIFGRFVKLDPDTPGSGLGLFVARQLAETIGATVTLNSGVLSGSVFYLTIPLT